jgi:hypothetical protein
MKKFFVYIEFTNKKVNELLVNLKLAFSNGAYVDTPHITVRGPYSQKPENTRLLEVQNEINGNYVNISDAGIFKTKKGYAVYLRAYSKIFENTWWKPDYKLSSFEKKAHITILETSNKEFAERVKAFLQNEQININTYGLIATIYQSKQQQIETIEFDENLAPQLERLEYRDGLVSRAASVVEAVEQAQERIYENDQQALFA